MRLHPDHYEALGISPKADAATVRAAYLRVMRAHHPDRRPGDAVALERARAANAAWEVLGNSARRASYDRLRVPHGAGSRPPLTHLAYSPDQGRYRADLTAATVRVAAAVVAAGTALLAALS